MYIANLSTIKNRETYLNLIKYTIRSLVDEYSNKLQSLFNLYTTKQIDDAINTIVLVGNKVFCPTVGTSGKILRILEYGDNQTNSYKILTQSTRKVLREIGDANYVI